MKKKIIFIACDTTSLKKIKRIIKETQNSKLIFGYKFGLQFLNSKVRIQSRFEWSNVTLFGGLRYLPPEALKGNSIGDNKRVNISGNIFLKENFSINININYISDIRYNNFINLNGELRAYF